MAPEGVSVRDEGPVRILTIERPRRRNAVDPATARELREAAHAFRDDDGARVLVLTGAGDEAFSAGADLQAWGRVLGNGRADDLLRGEGPLGFTRLTDVGKPTIAAINGWCLAGGMELAMWCDLRIAGGNARFGLPNRRWNIVLVDGGTQRLPRIVGLGRALDLVLTGRTFRADEALAMGFVSEVVPGSALPRAMEVAERIAAYPQASLRADRNALHAGLGLDLDEGLALEARSSDIYEDPEVLAATQELLQRFAAGER